jgi:dienelactone hydrolase/ubiquinone/menaquinone biosynthesis C-methylase UbiE
VKRPNTAVQRVERRRYPRARAGLTLTAPEGCELVDISPYGARVRLRGARLAPGEALSIGLRAQARPLEGEVGTRVAGAAGEGIYRLVFSEISPALQQEALRVARAQAFCDGIRAPFARGRRDRGFRAASPAQREALLRGLCERGVPLTLDRLHRGRPQRAVATGWSGGALALALEGEPPGPGEILCFCAALDYESALVQAEVVEAGPSGLTLLPRAALLTQRRAHPRRPASGAVAVLGQRLALVDRSRDGVALRDPGGLLVVGEAVDATLFEGDAPGQPVTLLPRYTRGDGAQRVVGAAALAPRPGEVRAPLAETRWTGAEVRLTQRPDALASEKIAFGPPDRRLAGLWTEVSRPGARTLVVAPPAWARTKESSALLAQLIAATFEAAGRHVAVLRLDYAETLGESHRGPAGAEAGREALGATLTGCVADIEAAIDAGLARLGDGARVALLGMSFSGPLCLRVAAGDPRVSCMAQLMGASDVQDLVRTATGGVDYVARVRAGLAGGLQDVLGLLSDVDMWVADGLKARLVTLADAQIDAARLSAPALWICGDHDAFVNPERVRGVLAASPAARRTLARVPCGHVPSRTREAVVAAAPLLRFLLDPEGPQAPGPIALCLPEEGALKAAVAAEWAAAPRATLASPEDYWRGYMLGEGEGALGFDALALTAEYKALMSLQAALLAPRPGEVVHDLGGGPGHAVPRLRAAAGGPIAVRLYDLVPEVMRAAADRWSQAPGDLTTCRWDAASEPPPAALGGAQKVLMSLFLSALPDPAGALRRIARALPPGAAVVASSICPDADLSPIYTRLVADVAAGRVAPPEGLTAAELVEAIRGYVSSAAWLLRLADEGTFKLFEPGELAALFTDSGFEVLSTHRAFGAPPRAVVVRAVRRGEA